MVIILCNLTMTFLWNLIKIFFYDSALILATLEGNTKIVRELVIQKGIDINIRDILNPKNIHKI